jgi:uncharacterized protein
VVVAENAILSDAAATAIGNIVISASDIQKGIAQAGRIEGVRGIVIIKDEEMGIWGDIELRRINVDSMS